MPKNGLWLVGARGGVATTAILGLVAMRRGLMAPTGLVSELDEFGEAGFARWEDWIVGGHEIRSTTLVDQAFQLAESSRAFERRIVEECRSELESIDREVRPGNVRHNGQMIESLADREYVLNSTTVSGTIERLRADWTDFAKRNGLKSIVVVNVASTEPPLLPETMPQTWRDLEKRLDDPGFILPPSVVYAVAAIGAGHSFVNFTPSTGSNLDAVRELACEKNICHAGRDGKTGETLLKSVLAPMFARRNLEVMSWVGHNIFGNMDGQVLNDPANKATKVASKDKLLGEILGYPPQTHVSIEYIRSLGDWKTAWDHIHFRGFLGTPMTMQFTWQGCDSILAAPLVLDLARFVELAARRGESGELGFLASFFKSPQGSKTHDFGKQFDLLCNWINRQPKPTQEQCGVAVE